MKHLGDGCTEADIKTYVHKLIGSQPKHRVASVNIAYDNLQEIRDCTSPPSYFTPYPGLI
jgi:hypothetical protein